PPWPARRPTARADQQAAVISAGAKLSAKFVSPELLSSRLLSANACLSGQPPAGLWCAARRPDLADCAWRLAGSGRDRPAVGGHAAIKPTARALRAVASLSVARWRPLQSRALFARTRTIAAARARQRQCRRCGRAGRGEAGGDGRPSDRLGARPLARRFRAA